MDAQQILAMQHFREGRYLFEAYNKETNALAIRHFKKATELDPKLTAALCWEAYGRAEVCRQNWTDDPSAALNKALALAEQAVIDAPEDYYTYWTRASVKMISPSPGVFADAGKDYETAEKKMGDKRDPTFLAERAEYLCCRNENGDLDKAIEDIATAKEHHNNINDNFPGWYHWLHAFAYLQKRDYKTASGLFKSVSSIGISNIAYILHAVCEAYREPRIPPEEVIAKLRVHDWDWTPEKMERPPFQQPEDIEHFDKGLVLAGLV
jgi:adenylate cyclase